MQSADKLAAASDTPIVFAPRLVRFNAVEPVIVKQSSSFLSYSSNCARNVCSTQLSPDLMEANGCHRCAAAA